MFNNVNILSLTVSLIKKEKLLQQIKSGELDNVATPDASPADESPSGEKTELSEWEKRLEGIS